MHYKYAILMGSLLLLAHPVLGQVGQGKGRVGTGVSEEIDFPNEACRDAYVNLYRDRPSPKMFYALNSPRTGKRECVSWVQAEKYPNGSAVTLTPERVISLLDKPSLNFSLLASDGVSVTPRQKDMVSVSKEPTPSKKPATPAQSSGSTPTWGQILTEGAANIAAARAGRQTHSSTSEPYEPSAATGNRTSSHRAPLAPATCATYRASRYEPVMDSTYVEWRNTCNYPIEVHWCWVTAGQARCKTDNAGNTLSPGETQSVVGPDGNVQPVAGYYVCDMSDASKICSGWD